MPGVENLPQIRHQASVRNAICEHDRRRSQCKGFLGLSIFPHKRIKSRCKDRRRMAPYARPLGAPSMAAGTLQSKEGKDGKAPMSEAVC